MECFECNFVIAPAVAPPLLELPGCDVCDLDATLDGPTQNLHPWITMTSGPKRLHVLLDH